MSICNFLYDRLILFYRLLLMSLRRIENNFLVLLLWFRREHPTEITQSISIILIALTSWISLGFSFVRMVRLYRSDDSCFRSLLVTCSSFLSVDASLNTCRLNRLVLQIDLPSYVFELFNLFRFRHEILMLLNGWLALCALFFILHLND
jgi:hypothetical protein